MEIWESKEGEITVLVVVGKFDATTAPLFEQRTLPLLERGERHFLIDMGHVDYISSAALRRLLVLAQQAQKAGGKVVLAALRAPIREIFEMAGFTQIFALYATREEALQSF